MYQYQIVVVGGGPAGMTAAIRAAMLGKNAVLLEGNDSLGKKLLLSGNTRGNITNITDTSDFIKSFGKNGEFLRSSLNKFSNRDLINFLEDKDLKIKVERQGRVFPKSNCAASVLDVLKSSLDENGVKIIYNAKVKNVELKDRMFILKLNDGRIMSTQKLILATGGASFSQTGSDGSGFRIAQNLGHKIIRLQPGLVPLETKETWVKNLQGLTLKNIQLQFIQGKVKIKSSVGELLFTHFGVSGPLVLDLSSQLVDLLEKGPVILSIDLKPGLTQDMLDKRLLRDFKERPSAIFKNILKDILPQKMIPIFLELLKIGPSKKANQITAQERRTVIALLKDFRLKIIRPRPLREAMVTCGGVSLKEINPRTMESRIIPGLYFCGEIIDVAAKSGGYNMQAAFSTGYLAGESAALN